MPNVTTAQALELAVRVGAGTDSETYLWNHVLCNMRKRASLKRAILASASDSDRATYDSLCATFGGDMWGVLFSIAGRRARL